MTLSTRIRAALRRPMAFGVLGAACLLSGWVPTAAADVVIGAWLVVVHDAPTHDAAHRWATAQCKLPPLAAFCTPAWNDGALGTTVGVYEATDWPGLEGGPWVIAVGPVRSRRTAATVQRTLAEAGVAARLIRLPALPRVQQWAADVAGRWRLWTVRGPATQEEVLYLSRDGAPDVVVARGWPLPRTTGGAELYPIGREPGGDAIEAYYYYAGAVRRLTPATGTVQPATGAGADVAAQVQAAAAARLSDPAPVHVEWTLPFAAAATVDLSGDGRMRRRFMLLRHRHETWEVERDEVQVSLQPAATVPAAPQP